MSDVAISPVRIEDLRGCPQHLSQIAGWHFEEWGPLTGVTSAEAHASNLSRCLAPGPIPATFVALSEDRLLGSVALTDRDLPIRPALTLWLAQLFVDPTRRGLGIGTSLVTRVTQEAARLGHPHIFLYTSGTLPGFYERLGWHAIEEVDHLKEIRTVMVLDLG